MPQRAKLTLAALGAAAAVTLTGCSSADTSGTQSFQSSPSATSSTVTAPIAPAATSRQIALEGASNVRDLGGIRTETGQTVVANKVFRADDLSALTPADVEVLEAAGVTTIIDFRGADEVADDGSAPVPDSIEVIHIPVLDDTTQALAEALTGVMRGGDPAAVEEMLGGGEAFRIKNESFAQQLKNEETMAGYGQTLELIADAPGAVVYHCTAGKDRTGMMTAILLGILGVPDETIIADFVQSNEYLADHYSETYAFLESKGVDVDLIRPLTEQEAANLQPVLDAVQNEYGGWDSFANDVLGVDNNTLEALRAKLLD